MESKLIISPVHMEERKALGLRAGDTVRVWQNIVEMKSQKQANKKEVVTKTARRQAFEGLVLAVKHGAEAGATFTVRRIASGVGVEKIFPLYSPMIESVEILKRAQMRRAKLYFIRDKVSREVKRQMRKAAFVAKISPKEEAPQEAASAA